MLARLGRSDLSASALSEGLALSQPALSKHLRILREAGLVTVEPQGRFQVYHLEAGAMMEVFDWVAKFEQFWPDRLDALGRHLRRGGDAP